jgi:hypothetical protein
MVQKRLEKGECFGKYPLLSRRNKSLQLSSGILSTKTLAYSRNLNKIRSLQIGIEIATGS